MQILVRTVHTVQQAVDPHRYSSGDGCHAPVVVQRQVPWLGRAENCGVPQLPFFWGSRNASFDYGYMFCIIQGGFWKNF